MSICLITKKELGEIVRELVIELDLLNNVYRIKKENSSLIIPITRELSIDELKRFQKLDIDIEIKEMTNLEEMVSKPKSHFEVLETQFSEEELALTPRSFDTIGDIVVIEIPDELWEKREIIGKSLLKAHSSIRTVYAKAGKVSGVNRLRPIELIAGEKKTKTIYKEHGIRLAVDLKQAYFSPRLSEEHSRIANKAKDDEIIVDLFCGVGPFVLPIGKRTNALIHAIDINPGAVELLKENILLNKLKGKIIPYCGDCRKVVEEQQLLGIADRVIMNLPGYAIQFVDVACKVLKPDGGIIHFFEFAGGDNPEETIIQDITREVEKAGRKIKQVLEVKKVRMSAPKQWQMVADVKIV